MRRDTFANELKDTATALNQHPSHQTVEPGATVTVRLATLPAEGPMGGFFGESGIVPW